MTLELHLREGGYRGKVVFLVVVGFLGRPFWTVLDDPVVRVDV